MSGRRAKARNFNLSSSQWLEWFYERVKVFKACMLPDGVMIFVLTFPRKKGLFDSNLFRLPIILEESLGLYMADVLIWDKLTMPPTNSHKSNTNMWEFCFVVSMNQSWVYHPWYEPYKKSSFQGGKLKPEGQTSIYSYKEGQKNRNPKPMGAVQGNVIRMGSTAAHRPRVGGGAFPQGLAKRFITQYSNKGDLILDPFCGSGTTLVEAIKLERLSIGIDIDNKAVKVSNEWISATLEELA